MNISFGQKIPMYHCSVQNTKTKEFVPATVYEYDCCDFFDAENIDKAADIASMAVPYGIYIEDYRTLEQEAWEIANIDLIDEELLAKDRTKGCVHIYISPEENYKEAIKTKKDSSMVVGFRLLKEGKGDVFIFTLFCLDLKSSSFGKTYGRIVDDFPEIIVAFFVAVIIRCHSVSPNLLFSKIRPIITLYLFPINKLNLKIVLRL